jgi:transposase InsO family protein
MNDVTDKCCCGYLGQALARTGTAPLHLQEVARTLLRSNRRVRLDFIDPGKPTQNAYSDSFDGRPRDERLNGTIFSGLGAWARLIIKDWRRDYNTNN